MALKTSTDARVELSNGASRNFRKQLIVIFLTAKLNWKVELKCFFTSKKKNVQRDSDSPILR